METSIALHKLRIDELKLHVTIVIQVGARVTKCLYSLTRCQEF
jgi:hypothetical protein